MAAMVMSGVACWLITSTVSPASAGWVPPPVMDDKLPDQPPLEAAARDAALNDPQLIKAYHLLAGAPPHWGEGAALLWKLAEAGNPAAQTALGWLFQSGHYLPQDITKADHWYVLAAHQGYAPAEFFLARLVRKSSRGTDPIFRTVTLHWARLAAAQNFVPAYFYVTRLYALGEGPNKDIAIAKRLIEEVRPIAGPCRDLIEVSVTRYGLAGRADERRADDLLRQAARQACWVARYDLAVRLNVGSDTLPMDKAEATRLFALADRMAIADALGQPWTGN
jgi:hypothetical protein